MVAQAFNSSTEGGTRRQSSKILRSGSLYLRPVPSLILFYQASRSKHLASDFTKLILGIIFSKPFLVLLLPHFQALHLTFTYF